MSFGYPDGVALGSGKNGFYGAAIVGDGGIGAVPIDNPEVMVFSVETTGPSETFTLPLRNISTYDVTIDWGDASEDTITTYNDASLTHTYTSADTYTVTVTANQAAFGQIYFNGGGDRLKIKEISQWGSVLEWDELLVAFFNCTNLDVTATDAGNFLGVTSLSSAFRGSATTSFAAQDFSNATTFAYAWADNSLMTTFGLIDCSSGTNFEGTWRDNVLLASFPLIDTSSGQLFEYCWEGNSTYTSFPLLDMSSATDLLGAWSGNSGLLSFPLIDTGLCENFIFTWLNCSSLTTFPAINCSSSNTLSSTWSGCSGLTSFGSINSTGVNIFANTWNGCGVFTSFPTDIDFSSMTNGTSCFSGSTIPTASWDAILVDCDDNNPNTSITFHGGSSKYTKGVVDSGTTDATTANKLEESGQNFLTTVTIGDVVYNTTDSTFARITAIDSDTVLSIDTDIMTSGEDYEIMGSAGARARFYLTNVDSWSIIDGGPDTV